MQARPIQQNIDPQEMEDPALVVEVTKMARRFSDNYLEKSIDIESQIKKLIKVQAEMEEFKTDATFYQKQKKIFEGKRSDLEKCK